MGNLVTYDLRPDLAPLAMSNGLTSVFIAVLSLAASALAEDDRRREIAVWIASRDQGFFGLGCVDFDLGDLPWRPESFAADRDFLLRTVDAALAETGWDRLGYEPRRDWIRDCLGGLRGLLSALTLEDATCRLDPGWGLGGKPERFELCPEHRVYRHVGGCVLCNELTLPPPAMWPPPSRSAS